MVGAYLVFSTILFAACAIFLGLASIVGCLQTARSPDEDASFMLLFIVPLWLLLALLAVVGCIVSYKHFFGQ